MGVRSGADHVILVTTTSTEHQLAANILSSNHNNIAKYLKLCSCHCVLSSLLRDIVDSETIGRLFEACLNNFSNLRNIFQIFNVVSQASNSFTWSSLYMRLDGVDMEN